MKTEREIYRLFNNIFEDKDSDLNFINMPKQIRKNGLKNYYMSLQDGDCTKNILKMIFGLEKLNQKDYMEKTNIVYIYSKILAKKFNKKKINFEKYDYQNLNNLNINVNYKIKSNNLGLMIDKIDNEVKNEELVSKNNSRLRYNTELNNKKNMYDEITKFLPNYKKISVMRRLLTPMIIGLGDTDTKEVSIKLDHVTGIPYIPASTIKGAFRSFIESKYGKKNELIEILFGNDFDSDESKKGNLIFMDAYPTEAGFVIESDIMTPHYYFQTDKPIDHGKTNPIKFYVVKNASFDFRIYASLNYLNKYNLNNLWLEFISRESLGAKKAVGYGQFEF